MSTADWPARLAPMVLAPALPAQTRAVDARSTAHPSMQLLLLEAAGRRLALDILQVAEVAKVPRITFVPCMPAFMRGVANVRGTLMPIVSLADVLHLSPSGTRQAPAPTPLCRVVVLRGPAPIALGVDRVLHVARLRSHELMNSPDDAAAQLPWAAAFAPLKDGLTAVLSVDALEHLLRGLQTPQDALA